MQSEQLTVNELGRAMATMLCRGMSALPVRMPDPPVNGDKVRSIDDVTAAIAHQARHFAERRVHDLQVRSVPIDDYANVLRHFYLRINDIVDVHPGTEQRISLRGWYETTDLGSDRLERRCLACSDCADACLAKCWRESQRFNLVARNCDHSFNWAVQSFAMANFIALVAFSLTCLLFSAAFRLLGLLMLLTLFGVVAMQSAAATFNGGLGLPWLVDPLGQLALVTGCCPHVFL